MGLLYRNIGEFFSYIGDIGDIGGTSMAGIGKKYSKFGLMALGSRLNPRRTIFSWGMRCIFGDLLADNFFRK